MELDKLLTCLYKKSWRVIHIKCFFIFLLISKSQTLNIHTILWLRQYHLKFSAHIQTYKRKTHPGILLMIKFENADEFLFSS